MKIFLLIFAMLGFSNASDYDDYYEDGLDAAIQTVMSWEYCTGSLKICPYNEPESECMILR